MMLTIGVLTVSDRCAQGTREDISGKSIGTLLAQVPDAVVSASAIVPDERNQIEAILRHWSDVQQLNLILTTGGTGLAPRDITPEATKAVIERDVPGITEAMRSASLQQTPYGMLSRGVAGTRRQTLIINLPGSPKAVEECLACILPVLPHAIHLLVEAPTEHENQIN